MSIFTPGSSSPELYATTAGKSDQLSEHGERQRYTQETGSATPKSHIEKTRERYKESQALSRAYTADQLFDPAHLQLACELLDNIEPTEPVSATVNLADVGAVVVTLWEAAEHASPVHKEILAALDAGIVTALATGNISADHISAFREALGDLSLKTVSEVQAEAIRSRFVDLGHPPLAILSSMDENDVAESNPDPTVTDAAH